MNIDTVRQAAEHASFLALGIAFLAGLVFSFNPVALASIPVALAYVTKARTTGQSVTFGVAFALGMILAQVLLGFLAGLTGNWIAGLAGRQWGLLLGTVLILLGFVWAGWLRIPLPAVSLRATRPTTPFGAFVLGTVFSVAVCPVCNPELVALVGAAAGSGSPFFGAALLFFFAVGRAIPIVLGAPAVGWLENLKVLSKYHKPIEVFGGVTMVVFGLYMLNAYYFWVPFLAM
jgi:cytochrome c-type biogenesis protein